MIKEIFCYDLIEADHNPSSLSCDACSWNKYVSLKFSGENSVFFCGKLWRKKFLQLEKISRVENSQNTKFSTLEKCILQENLKYEILAFFTFGINFFDTFQAL